MASYRRSRSALAGIGIVALAGTALAAAFPACAAAAKPSCTCGTGRSLEPGVVSYSRNGDREVITKIEPESKIAGSSCTAVWIAGTEIHTRGTPYGFYLQRTAQRERRIEGCGDLTERFVKRSKTYAFVFGSDSTSIREMPSSSSLNPQLSGRDPNLKSNANLWAAIIPEDPAQPVRTQERFLKIDPTREFNRTSWVFSRKNIHGHFVGIIKDSAQNETLVPLKKTHQVNAGQLGQIEAADSRRAIVRFYSGSSTETFAGAKNAIRRWYDKIGGPYKETKDDLYTALRAYIVEVSLDDIIEVNDYFDQAKTDRTRPVGL
jgi:hypothetical protein